METITKNPYVVLVDEKDETKGVCEKVWAHKVGTLHRAVSVILLDQATNRFLLQKRSLTKYHSGGKWSNAACTHVLLDETPEQAAMRALSQELNITANLTPFGSFIYREDVGDSLIEHEFDHLFIGNFSAAIPINANEEEVEAIEWIQLDELDRKITKNPETFSAWLPYVLGHFYKNKDSLN